MSELVGVSEGKFVRFAPLIAGRVPVKFAAGILVKDAPEPEKVVAGVVALFLESRPSATSAEVKDFIRTHASQMLPNSEWLNPYPTDNNAEYWRDSYNNRGAANRVVYDPTASDAEVKISGVEVTGISFKQS